MELNKIYNGDAYKLIKEIPNKSIDLILTDPPYLIKGLHDGTGIFKGKPKGYITEMRENDLGESIDLSILDEFVRVLKKINIYIWCNKDQMLDYMNYFIKDKKCNFELIVWAKTNTAPFTNGHYLKDKEYCLFFWEKGVKIKGNYDTLKTIYISTTNIEDKKLYKHPTIKPLNIIKNFIINSVEDGGGGIVLDPFLGSGTTAVACKELNRNYIGFEKNEIFYQIAIDRVNGIKQNEKLNKYQQLTLF